MNIIDQNKNIIVQRRNLSLQTGIWKLNGRIDNTQIFNSISN